MSKVCFPCGWPPGPQSICQRPGCNSKWPFNRCIYKQIHGAHVGAGNRQDCICHTCDHPLQPQVADTDMTTASGFSSGFSSETESSGVPHQSSRCTCPCNQEIAEYRCKWGHNGCEDCWCTDPVTCAVCRTTRVYSIPTSGWVASAPIPTEIACGSTMEPAGEVSNTEEGITVTVMRKGLKERTWTHKQNGTWLLHGTSRETEEERMNEEARLLKIYHDTRNFLWAGKQPPKEQEHRGLALIQDIMAEAMACNATSEDINSIMSEILGDVTPVPETQDHTNDVDGDSSTHILDGWNRVPGQQGLHNPTTVDQVNEKGQDALEYIFIDKEPMPTGVAYADRCDNGVILPRRRAIVPFQVPLYRALSSRRGDRSWKDTRAPEWDSNVLSDVSLGELITWSQNECPDTVRSIVQQLYIIEHSRSGLSMPVVICRAEIPQRLCHDVGCERCLGKGGYRFQWRGPWSTKWSIVPPDYSPYEWRLAGIRWAASLS